MKNLVIGVWLTLLLASCTSPDESSQAIDTDESRAAAALAQAKNQLTPFDSYKALLGNDSDTVKVARMQYLKKAIEAGDNEALDRLYSQGSDEDVATLDSGGKLAQAAVEKGVQFSEDFYLALGHRYDEGRGVSRNTFKAAEYYAMCWLKGNGVAALSNYKMYDGMGDPYNAYLWAIRAGSLLPQERMPNSPKQIAEAYVDDGALKQSDIQDIEKLAADKSVITLTKAK